MIKDNKKLQGKLGSRAPNIHIVTEFSSVTQEGFSLMTQMDRPEVDI